MDKEYKKIYFLTPGESDAQQSLPLTLLTSRIIEIATEHANTLHIGYADMNGMNLGWVLSRLTIEMLRWPSVNEEYTIVTWIESWNRHFSERNFEIRDKNGEVIGYARTVWMVINTITHENAGTESLHLADGLISDRECPIAKQSKLRAVECDNPDTYIVRLTDIDFYRHVNTVKYVALLINQFSLDDLDRNYIRRFEIAFMQEGRYGDAIKIMRSDEAGKSDIELIVDNKSLIRSRILMMPR